MRSTALHATAACVVAVIAVAAAAPGPSATVEGRVQAQASAVRLSGRILNEDGSAPVVRARVTVLADGWFANPAFSDDLGRFEIDVPESAQYVLAIARTGFLRTTVRRPSTNAPPEPLDVRLSRSAVITGFALDPAGRTVTGIRVRVLGPGGASVGADSISDDRGEFRISGLSPGRYSVVTIGRPEPENTISLNVAVPDAVQEMRNQDLGMGRGAPTSDAVTVEAKPGVVTEATVVYREPKVILPYALVGGVVSGHLLDEWSTPAEGIRVQLWKRAFQGGQPIITPYGTPRMTDDRGQYRLYHIPAGSYLLLAADESSQLNSQPGPWLPVYYPGHASLTGATWLQVGRSQELAGVNMTFTRTRGSRVFGLALDSENRPHSRVSLVAAGSLATLAPRPLTVSVKADGTFEFLGVPPGDYVARVSGAHVEVNTQTRVTPGQGVLPAELVRQVQANGGTLPPDFVRQFESASVDAERLVGALAGAARQNTAPIEVGLQPIVVTGADVGPIFIRTAQAATLRGRAEFQGARRSEPFAIRAVSDDPALADLAGRQAVSRATIGITDGTFELRGVAGAVRLVLSDFPAGWWIKSARVGATDASKDAIALTGSNDSRDDVTIVLADTAASLAATAVGADGQPAEGTWLVIFAVDRSRWFFGSPCVRVASASSKGSFSVQSLPPGDYFVAVVDRVDGDTEYGEWQYPSFLESLAPAARRVTLTESQRLTMPQRLTVVARAD